jgi:hypothetical protein
MYFATLFATLILFIFFLLVLLAIYPVKVAAAFNSEQQPDVHIIMSWLNPFVKGFVTRHGTQITLTVKLFNKSVLVKDLSLKKGTGFGLKGKNYMDYINIAKSLKIYNAKLTTSYGSDNPAITGVLCGAINIITQQFNLNELYNNADFFTERSYFNISCEAEINAVVSFIRVIKRKRPYLNAHVLGGTR